MKTFGKLAATTMLAVAGLWGGGALAAPVSTCAAGDIVIGTGNNALSGYTGPFACLGISLTGQTATFTFTSIYTGAGGVVFLMGDGGSAALNLNSGSFSVGSISGSNSGTGFNPGGFTNTGPGNVDGFGMFNLTIKDFDGFTHAADLITFAVTNSDVNHVWNSISDVLLTNDLGANAAVHVFVTTYPADASNGALVTGFAGGPGTEPRPLPEPGTIGLLGLGLVGIAIGLRRRPAN